MAMRRRGGGLLKTKGLGSCRNLVLGSSFRRCYGESADTLHRGGGDKLQVVQMAVVAGIIRDERSR
jgi:hypothetical protein